MALHWSSSSATEFLSPFLELQGHKQIAFFWWFCKFFIVCAYLCLQERNSKNFRILTQRSVSTFNSVFRIVYRLGYIFRGLYSLIHTLLFKTFNKSTLDFSLVLASPRDSTWKDFPSFLQNDASHLLFIKLNVYLLGTNEKSLLLNSSRVARIGVFRLSFSKSPSNFLQLWYAWAISEYGL